MLDLLYPEQYQFTAGGLQARIGAWVIALRTALNDAEQLVEEQLPAWVQLRIIDERPVLFAFASEERRQMFTDLLAIPGIGPESALLIMELGSNQEILLAVASDDQSFFRQVPGIGPARIKALGAAIGKKYSLPAASRLPIIQWRLVQDRFPELSADDQCLDQLQGQSDDQLLTTLQSWEPS